jgi:2-oxoglutarate dehydrogenase E1 component
MARQEANNVFALTSLLYGANAAYIEDLYASYKTDPNSVDPEWRDFFAAFQDEKDAVLKEARGAPWKRKDWPLEASGDLVNAFDGNWAPIEQKLETKLKQKADTTGAPMSDAEVHQATRDSVRAMMMIRAYRMRGHLHADLDPLELREPATTRSCTHQLRFHRSRLGPQDLHRQCAGSGIRNHPRDA